MSDPFPVTPESIARAKAAQQAERARVTALTGVKFTDDGFMRLPDDVEVGLALGNWLLAAVYGVSGEKRN